MDFEIHGAGQKLSPNLPGFPDGKYARCAAEFVIAAYIPLVAAVIEKHGRVIDPRGKAYTTDNIQARLAMRKFMDESRASDVDPGAPRPYSHADRPTIAKQLDRLLAQTLSSEFAPKPRAPGA
jgi:uncharacterized protein YaiI (UPF0178 family)